MKSDLAIEIDLSITEIEYRKLRECVGELKAWARSRIEWCRKEEQKFKAGDNAIEAATERRALQAVLRMLP